MNIRNRLSLFAIALLMFPILFNSCGGDDDGDTTTPIARMVVESFASVFDTVYVDGSPSENANSFEWSGSGPNGDIVFQGGNSSKTFFVPSRNGSYNIVLRVTNNSEFNETYGSVVVSGARRIGGTLTENLTLTNIEPDPDSCDYLLTEDLIIPGEYTLTVENGVNICVAKDVAIIATGGLTIEGGTIKGVNGNWKGINIPANGGGFVRMTNSYIEDAGSASFTADASEAAAIYMGRTSGDIANVYLTNSAGYGLVMAEKVTSSSVTCIFENNASGPCIVSLEQLAQYAGLGSFAGSDLSSYIKVRGGDVSGSDLTLFDPGLPYMFLGDIKVQNFQAISSGNDEINVYMADDTGIECGLFQTTKFRIEALSQKQGAWKGIKCKGAALENSTILYAGSAPWTTNNDFGDFNAGLLVEGAVQISASEISYCTGYGVVAPYTLNRFEQNVISFNTSGAVVCDFDFAGDVSVGQSTFEGYGAQPIVTIIDNTGFSKEMGTWKKISAATSSIDYSLRTGAYGAYGSDWVIEKGVFVECQEDVQIAYGRGKKLTAIGSKSEKIVFKGSSSQPGHWKGFFLDENSTVELDYVEFNFGGGETVNTYQGCLNIHPSINMSSSITNCSFLNGGTYDLFFLSGIDALDIKNVGNNNIFVKSN